MVLSYILFFFHRFYGFHKVTTDKAVEIKWQFSGEKFPDWWRFSSCIGIFSLAKITLALWQFAARAQMLTRHSLCLLSSVVWPRHWESKDKKFGNDSNLARPFGWNERFLKIAKHCKDSEWIDLSTKMSMMSPFFASQLWPS